MRRGQPAGRGRRAASANRARRGCAFPPPRRARGWRARPRPTPPANPPAATVSGDRVRNSPLAGVPISNGSLSWQIRFVGDPGQILADGTITMGKDVDINVTFTPTAGAGACPTITYLQTV